MVLLSESEALRERLSHVLWIGGATDAGKTSVARALAERYGLQVYHYDRMDRVEAPGHWSRVDPARQPHMQARLGKSLDEQWVETTPEELAAEWRLIAAERFGLTVDDLMALPPGPVVAEGYGLLPELVAPLLGSPRQAVWLVPTEEFKRATYGRREELGQKGTRRKLMSDPVRARHNHIGRDLLIGQMVIEQAQALGLAANLQIVDGSRTLEQVAAAVAAHFGPLLPRCAAG